MLTKVLRDGRTLAFREYGRADGFPIIFTHGNLNSRLFEPAWTKTAVQAEEAGARVFAVDRPGYGGSTNHEDRTYSTWAEDVDELATHLSLDRYAVVGYSSGGPHALACAARNIRNRVASCGLVASDAPYAHPNLDMVQQVFGVPNVGLEWSLTNATKNAESMRAAYSSMKDEARKAIALADLQAATEQGMCGAASDAVLEAAAGGDWGFDLASVSVPTLLWHGDSDADVPVEAGRFLADCLPAGTCRTHFLEGENHTLIRRHWGGVLRAVVDAATASECGRQAESC